MFRHSSRLVVWRPSLSLLALTSKQQAGCIKPSVLSSRSSQGLSGPSRTQIPAGRPRSSAAAPGDSNAMTPVPLLLLLSSALLSSHLRPAAGGARSLPGRLDGGGRRLQTRRLDRLLLRAAAAGDSAASGPLGDGVLRLLRGGGSGGHPDPDPDPVHLLLLKRSEEPPLSIDLTFHLLRNMIQMAKMESQREQALLNRKVLDEVGK